MTARVGEPEPRAKRSKCKRGAGAASEGHATACDSMRQRRMLTHAGQRAHWERRHKGGCLWRWHHCLIVRLMQAAVRRGGQGMQAEKDGS